MIIPEQEREQPERPEQPVLFFQQKQPCLHVEVVRVCILEKYCEQLDPDFDVKGKQHGLPQLGLRHLGTKC